MPEASIVTILFMLEAAKACGIPLPISHNNPIVCILMVEEHIDFYNVRANDLALLGNSLLQKLHRNHILTEKYKNDA